MPGEHKAICRSSSIDNREQYIDGDADISLYSDIVPGWLTQWENTVDVL